MRNFSTIAIRAAAGLSAIAALSAFAYPANAASRHARDYVALYDTPAIDVESSAIVNGYDFQAGGYSQPQIDCAMNVLSRDFPPKVNFNLVPAFHNALDTVCSR